MNANPTTSSTPLRTGQARLAACHQAATRLQRVDWASEPERWVGDARLVVGDTIGVLVDLVRAAEAPPSPPPLRGDSTAQFIIHLQGVRDAPTPAHQRVGDLAFVAAAQLRRKLAALEEARVSFETAPQPACHAHLADALGSSIRHVLRATCVVEPELAWTQGVAPRLSCEAECVRSMAVRRGYTAFRRAVQAAPPGREGLLVVQRALVELTLDVGYRDAWPSDRLEIEALRERVEHALSAHGEDPGRLLTDVRAFASVLRFVTRREELLVHDLEALPQIIALVTDLSSRGRPVLLGHLDAIRGIDDDIEALLESGATIDGPRLLELLVRADQERRATAGTSFT